MSAPSTGCPSWRATTPALTVGMFVALASATACGPVPSRVNAAEQTALAVCEKVVTARILSPASYKRIWSDVSEAPAQSHAERLTYVRAASAGRYEFGSDRSDLDAAIEAVANKMEKERLRKVKTGEKLSEVEAEVTQVIKARNDAAARNAPADRGAIVLLEYDSQNAYGTPIRSFHVCRLEQIGDDGRFEQRDMFYDSEISRQDGEQMKALKNTAQIK